MLGTHGDHSGRAGVDVHPRLLADTLAITLTRRGYTVVDLTGQQEPRVLVDLAIIDEHTRAPAGARVVIELPSGPDAPARVHVDGVEITTRFAGLADLEALLDGLTGQL